MGCRGMEIGFSPHYGFSLFLKSRTGRLEHSAGRKSHRPTRYGIGRGLWLGSVASSFRCLSARIRYCGTEYSAGPAPEAISHIEPQAPARPQCTKYSKPKWLYSHLHLGNKSEFTVHRQGQTHAGSQCGSNLPGNKLASWMLAAV
jgi:hypothetical protein